ncbi:hypothetical protein FHT44_006260 [Mycolicibacterium sp. BK634]|uniref:alpha/beta hydrolase n=1 Tax=Mycobacteriaceae TaxID=1762 RepID=UPI000D4F2D77|nr:MULTISPECIES: alpha/beta hydrolase [Mycobacteriaceae]MBB3753738.1 hypothetical protein [Mycolicibacterium sp. BK634]TDO06585.1 alpha/beta hydrolase family protein [Mycobacterium sp. BK086]
MTTPLEGPTRVVDGPGNTRAPFYVIPFDKEGTCVGPRTRQRLLGDATTASDIFLFSHGWNNTWPTALNRYNEFITAYLAVRQHITGPPRPGYAPVLAGVFWPSAVLVGADEQAPQIAAAPDLGALAPDTQDLLELTANLSSELTARASELLTKDRVNEQEALEAARLLTKALGKAPDELGQAEPDATELLDIARQLSQSANQSVSRRVGGLADTGGAAEPEVAALSDLLDPRQLIRAATVLMMKDRAGRVGATGVSQTLLALRAANPDAHIHLIGHSYGAKVVLSALCAPSAADSVTVNSVLLLQAATSCYCFAPAGAIPGSDLAGGYSHAPARTAKPIMSTFSKKDVPLTRLFHLAARRDRDLGEPEIASESPVPSRYAALGGYGPQGVASTTVDAAFPPTDYTFGADPKIVGVRSDEVISGHGDVANPATAWMLLSQVRD